MADTLGPHMLDLATLEKSRFDPLLNSTFRVHAAERVAEVTLVEVRAIGREIPGRRRAFSLIFRAPEGVAFVQGTYRFEQEALGMLDLFAVPVAWEERGNFIEVIFN